MSSLPPSLRSLGERLELALSHVRRLKRLLDDEIEALRVEDLDQFERVQDSKADILRAIAELKIGIEGAGEPGVDYSRHPAWSGVIDALSECKELHIRNETLINMRLDTIRAALGVLHAQNNMNSTDVYDRLGRPARARSYLGWEDV